MYGYGNSMFLATTGILARGGGGIDPDAQAFITAAAITDPTQQAAINTLVVDLKGYNIWTKFQAIYPVVGGVASSHAVNLKTPGTYNLSFTTGWTHSNTGMTPNGASAYADTGLNDNTVLSLNNAHLSFYSRTNVDGLYCDIGVFDAGPVSAFTILSRYLNGFRGQAHDANSGISNTDSRGLFLTNRVNSTQARNFINSTLKLVTVNSISKINYNISIGARYRGFYDFYSPRQCAFASIGDGLTDTDAANFYTAVQAFQTTLGRSIGTQTVSDADAQAFVTAANITDQVEADAINTLVIGMKADGIWTKMKAIYPIVGGVASSHAVNLKTPGTFNLTFTNAWTHSSTGMTPNGTSAYANTGFNPLTQSLPRNSASMGVYNRTNNVIAAGHGQRVSNNFELFDPWNDGNVYAYINNGSTGFSAGVTNSLGLFQGSRTSSTAIAISRNNTITNGSSATTGDSNGNLWIGASNNGGTGTFFNNRQIAFFYIGEGFNNTEMQNIYTRVQTYQTTLSRQV